MDEVKWGSTNRGTRECGAGFLFGCLSLLLTSSIHLQVELARGRILTMQLSRPATSSANNFAIGSRELADCTAFIRIQRKKGAEDSEVDAASSF